MIQSNIRIKPYCVFCSTVTQNVETYNYYDAFGMGYDRILIRFPAQRLCFLLRKVGKFGGFFTGALVFELIRFLASALYSHDAGPSHLPIWVTVAAGIAGLLVGGFLFLRIRSRMVGAIHDYYVCNETIPEADKSWRRRLGAYRIGKR